MGPNIACNVETDTIRRTEVYSQNGKGMESVIDSIPPPIIREHTLGIQVTVAELLKGKLEPEAADALQKIGEALLQQVVLEARTIVTLALPNQLDPKPRPEDISRAFERVVSRASRRGGNTSRVSKFFNEIPVVLFAVGLTKLADAARAALDHKPDLLLDMCVASVSLLCAISVTFILGQRD